MWPRGGSAPSTVPGSQAPAESSPNADSARAPPATNVPAGSLRPILLTASQITTTTKDTLVLEQDGHDLLDDSATINTPKCLGAWAPAQQSVYADSGWTGVAAQMLRGMNKQVWQDSVTQAVIAFPSPTKAIESLQAQRKQWEACAGRAVTTPPGESAQTWDFGQPATTAGTFTLDATLRGGAGFCQHGIAVSGNVVIDIRQCRSQGGNDVAALVSATANKVPRQ